MFLFLLPCGVVEQYSAFLDLRFGKIVNWSYTSSPHCQILFCFYLEAHGPTMSILFQIVWKADKFTYFPQLVSIRFHKTFM
jgi:hypothetical protein